MDEISVALVNGDSGLTVTEQLQTLRVACPVGDGVSSSAVPALFLQGPDLQGSGESPTEGPAGLAEEQVAEPVRAATNGGDSVERIWQPDSPHSLLEPPELGSKGALLEGETSSSSSSSDCVWPGVSAVAAAGEASPGTGARAAEQQQEQARQEPEAPVEGEKDKASPVSCPVEDTEVLDSNSSAPRLLAFSGDVESEEVTCRLASAGPEGQAALPGGRLGKEGLAMEDSSSSSDSEADSDTDTDSSSSVSSSSSGLPMLSDEDADQPDKNEHDPIKQKDELFEQKLLPVEDVNIILPEFVELMSFGKVSSVIEHLVIIESLKGLQPVNENTVLFKEDRHSIGKVFEVFGPVSHPFYVLQFNSPEHIETKGVKVHDTVYFAPSVKDFTQYIFPEKLKQYKGSDASWENDEEPPPEALEFSDDEKESAAKHQKKKSQNSRKKLRSLQEESNENETYQSRRQYPSDGSRGWRRGECNPSFSRGCRRGEHNPSFSRGCRRGEYNPGFSRGFHRGEYNPSFSSNRFPHSSSPQCFLRPPVKPPQHYVSDSTEPQELSPCYPQPSENGPGSHQYAFPPPPFETVSYEANHFPPPSATWGWPSGYTQNVYDPLLALLSLPPPPPPPSPPPPPPPSPPPSPAPS